MPMTSHKFIAAVLNASQYGRAWMTQPLLLCMLVVIPSPYAVTKRLLAARWKNLIWYRMITIFVSLVDVLISTNAAPSHGSAFKRGPRHGKVDDSLLFQQRRQQFHFVRL
jgi:hypothetical protein